MVDRLLANEQHGVRYARHWLDVLRYADADERMIAAPGIHLWRDWVINALNDDVPYDQFVRAQLTGYRSTERTQMSATGFRSQAEPRPDDCSPWVFSRAATWSATARRPARLAIAAVETVSTAFMGLTVGCAKCHDHMYDPISQRDFYAMKALFDPLVLAQGDAGAARPKSSRAGKAPARRRSGAAAVEAPLNDLVAPYKKKLYEDRVAMLPADVQAIIRKPEKERTAAEQKIADDYFPILRIDADKIPEVMPAEARKKYQELQAQLERGGGGRGGAAARRCRRSGPWRSTRAKAGEELHPDQRRPERPEKDHEVKPGWPFATGEDRLPRRAHRGVLGLADGAGESAVRPRGGQPAVAMAFRRRVAQDAERLRQTRRHAVQSAAARLARVGVRRGRGFSMKQMHRLMVTSDTYKLASEAEPALAAANRKVDPGQRLLWHSACSGWRRSRSGMRSSPRPATWIWQSAARRSTSGGGGGRRAAGRAGDAATLRREPARRLHGPRLFHQPGRGAELPAGVRRGRRPRAVPAADANGHRAAGAVHDEQPRDRDRRPRNWPSGCRRSRAATCRPRSTSPIGSRWRARRRPRNENEALTYLENDAARLKGLAWLLFNLDEFIYVR